jgi:hypothetical protein
MIGNESMLKMGDKQVAINTYGLLFDSTLGAGTKGGEPGWTPPVPEGRCVRVSFSIGETHPNQFTLTIPALEQSMPEVIPADQLSVAYPRLLAQGIDMEWHIQDHGAYPEYKKLPAGMTEQEAMRKFIEALGYTHQGPWIFNVTLTP